MMTPAPVSSSPSSCGGPLAPRDDDWAGAKRSGVAEAAANAANADADDDDAPVVSADPDADLPLLLVPPPPPPPPPPLRRYEIALSALLLTMTNTTTTMTRRKRRTERDEDYDDEDEDPNRREAGPPRGHDTEEEEEEEGVRRRGSTRVGVRPTYYDCGRKCRNNDNDDNDNDEKGGRCRRRGRNDDKQLQVRCMLACLDPLLTVRGEAFTKNEREEERGRCRLVTPRRLTLVDMGGGTGHLAIPMALKYPNHRVVVIDLNRHSLHLMKGKATTAWREKQQKQQQQQRALGDQPVDGTTILRDPGTVDSSIDNDNDNDDEFIAAHPDIPLEETALPNLYALCGPIEKYLFARFPTTTTTTTTSEQDDAAQTSGKDAVQTSSSPEPSLLRFDVGVALHLCGQGTDVALRACLQQDAALIVAPCCVGKIQTTRKNPYVWQATHSNISTIQYPQSNLYRQLLQFDHDDNNNEADKEVTDGPPTPSELWNALASAADDSTTRHPPEVDGVDDSDHRPRNTTNFAYRQYCCRRTAKVLVEWDRCLFLQQHNYHTLLTRMVPTSASPKHDIIVATPDSWTTRSAGCNGHGASPFFDVDHEALVEVEETRRYLQALSGWASCVNDAEGAPSGPSSPSQARTRPDDGGFDAVPTSYAAWDETEVAEVRERLTKHFALGGVSLREPSNDATQSQGHAGQAVDDDVYYFPIGMGRERRKLIHYVAATLGLEHWSHGKKEGTGKTVAVARPGTRRKLPARAKAGEAH